MLIVQFVTPYAPYNAGEQAGFVDDLANRLVAEGVAVPVSWTPVAPVEAQALQAFEGGAASAEQETQAAHLAGDVGEKGEIVGGQ